MADRAERRPCREWTEVASPVRDPNNLACSAWVSGHVAVISSLTMAEMPDGRGDVGPQWHISITRKRRRPHDTDVRRALRAFRMVGAEEDNHHPGNARHFWLPVDPSRRVDCECKTDEATIVEADGYRYTNPHDPAECRGCELQALIGKACPLHGQEVLRGG
jgi:hypothetical protein